MTLPPLNDKPDCWPELKIDMVEFITVKYLGNLGKTKKDKRLNCYFDSKTDLSCAIRSVVEELEPALIEELKVCSNLNVDQWDVIEQMVDHHFGQISALLERNKLSYNIENNGNTLAMLV